MSKQGTSRSRAEKSRGAASAVVPVSNDIVPGKYTEYDLNMSVEQEHIDEYIFSIIENVLQDSEKHIYEKYLNSRIIPHTVNLAKTAILKIIEWNFLIHDKGELDEHTHVWLEDEEPESCTIDSWAQGYFPKRQASFAVGCNPTEIIDFVFEENCKFEESEEEIEESVKLSTEFNESEISGSGLKNDELIEDEPEEKSVKVECTNVDQKPINIDKISQKKSSFKPYRGKLNFDNLNMLTETLSETEHRLGGHKVEDKTSKRCSSRTSHQTDNVDYEKKVIQKLFGGIVKNYQQLRPNDILLNTNEQLLVLMKIPNDQVTPQRVKANHKTLEVAMSRVNVGAKKENSDKKKISNSETSYFSQSRPDEFKASFVQHDKHPLPASMLDSIDPVPGVIVQEGDRVKKSTNKRIERERKLDKEFLHLRPVKMQQPQAVLMVHDIINVNQVSIKPMKSPTPIPPIPNGYKLND